MKIFITGATGFIGNQVVQRLSQTDHELVCLIRKNNEASEKLKLLGAKLVLGDITSKASMIEGMKGCDCLIHLAAVFTLWEPDNNIYKEVNVIGTRNVMECALEARVSKVVYVSTVVVYGKPADSPFTEESEMGPVRFSKYSQTKYAAEQVVWELHKNKGLPVVVVYPGAVLGAGDPKAPGNYISDIAHGRMPAKVLKNSVLTWVYVKDVAEAIVRALEKPDNVGEKYLIGKHRLTMSEFNNVISEVSGARLPLLAMSDTITMAGAYLLTGLSNIFKFPPPMGMSVDQMRIMKEGFSVDGSKAERELGLTYTPIRVAIQEELATEK